MTLSAEKLMAAIGDISRWKRGQRTAPHKPLTLLYALGRVDRGEDRLVSFAAARERLTQLLKEYGPHNARSIHPEYPFQRLANDGFWELQPRNLVPRKSNTDAPVGELLRKDARAGFTAEAYNLLRTTPGLVEDAAARILDASFPDSLHEPIRAAVGLGEVETTKKQQNARDPVFRSLVLEAYGRQCAVCGFDVRVDEVSLAVEAAHIKWHQRGGPAVVTNGVAMCAVHHTIFDRGAISFTLDHRIIVATGVSRSESAKMWLWRFNGHELQLPPRKNMFPDARFVTWHHKNVFRGSP